LPGLKGIGSIADDPAWARVLAKQGFFFVVLDRSCPAFSDKGLTDEGKKVLKAFNQNDLLVIARDLDPSQAEDLLQQSQDPLIFLSREVPDDDIVELIKRKKSALGLILGQGEPPSAYFIRLNRARKRLSVDHLLIANERCMGEGRSGTDAWRDFRDLKCQL